MVITVMQIKGCEFESSHLPNSPLSGPLSVVTFPLKMINYVISLIRELKRWTYSL